MLLYFRTKSDYSIFEENILLYVRKENIMVSPGEYHLNQNGVKILYSIIRKRLDEMDLKSH